MSALDDAIASIHKDQDLRMGSLDASWETFQTVGLSTGNIALDALTGIGGYPQGRIVEQFGPPSSGKTTSLLQAMALAQQRGEYVAFFDYEKTLDPKYCAQLGLDVGAKTFIYSRPKTFEQGANAFRTLMETGQLAIAGFDSVATMVTKHELEAATGAVQVADRAKMMHQFLRQIVTPAHETKTTVVFLNHVMKVVDTTFMGQQAAARGMTKDTTPGGQALPFYASLRIQFKQGANVKTEELSSVSNQKEKTATQTKVHATVVKNKVGNPFGTVELRVRFGKGFSNEYSAFHILVNHKIIKKKAAGYFVFPAPLGRDNLTDEWQGHGEDNIIEALENDGEWFSRVAAAAQDAVESFGVDKVDGSMFDSDGNFKVDSQDSNNIDAVLGA